MPRLVTALVTAALVAAGTTAATSTAGHADAAADPPVYFVHGYAPDGGSDCDKIWPYAVDHFTKQGRSPHSLKTVAYYAKDTGCDVDIGNATTGTRITHIAAALANHIHDHHTSKGQSIQIVAHSMGGLITRVAMLGSAKGWDGFPDGKLKVSDIVTLSTPHQGILDADKYDSTQWDSMVPGSRFLDVLQAPGNRIDKPWADGTDWSFAGSDEDETVSTGSGIDKDRHADHKYRYLPDADYDISHTNIREMGPGRATFNLRYWHATEGEPYDTTKGWSPLETAYNAIDRGDNW